MQCSFDQVFLQETMLLSEFNFIKIKKKDRDCNKLLGWFVFFSGVGLGAGRHSTEVECYCSKHLSTNKTFVDAGRSRKWMSSDTFYGFVEANNNGQNKVTSFKQKFLPSIYFLIFQIATNYYTIYGFILNIMKYVAYFRLSFQYIKGSSKVTMSTNLCFLKHWT